MIHGVAVPYAGAVADGELNLVPAEVLAHIRSCPLCAREIEWHQEVNASLAGAFAAEATEDPRPAQVLPLRRPWQRSRLAALVAGIAAAALLVATVGVVSRGGRGGGGSEALLGAESVMTAAEHGYGTAPAMASSDANAVGKWAAAHGMGDMRPPGVTGATLMGARTWSVEGREAVTFTYVDPAGQTEVTALAGPLPPGWPMSETRMMGGHAVGVLGHGSIGMVIVAPDDATLTRTMSAIQQTQAANVHSVSS